ncbi:MAG: flagellar type III secretion system protein FlhB [Leptospira sp.]|nr:flagellar type III secretion system protein FlhB [Leptospira sp.]
MTRLFLTKEILRFDFFPPKSDYLIDLQLFAAEDEGRTEEASERRRREEREKGNVPKSNEIPAALVLLSGDIIIFILGKYFLHRSSLLLTKYFQGIANNTEFTNESVTAITRSAGEDIFYLLVPILGITFVMAIIGNIVQVGFLFAPRALGFNFSRVQPNFKKVLPTRQTLVNLMKSLAKVAVIGWISYLIISADFLPVLLTGEMGLLEAVRLVTYSAVKIFIVVGIVLFAISIADFYYNKFEYEESLKMTPSEAKQELREQEGDKTLLGRRRQMVREFIRRGMLQKVPKADVVITNPTHFAVALQFDRKIHDTPVVIAKGMDTFALTIKSLAKKHNVPIIENKSLARLLYEEAEEGMPIPGKFFEAIARIISRLEKYKREFAA